MSDDFVPAASSDPVVTERRHTVLTQLAKSEDISDFVGERTDEAALFDRGEPISNERAARALNEANSGVQQQVQPDATPLTEEDLESHFRTRALSQLAKSEDIEDYLAERQAQERYFEEGETLSDDEQDAWFKRARSALQDTHAELTGEPPPDEATQREREYQDFAEYGRREGAAA